VSDFLESKGLLPENTRVRKTGDGYEVLIASSLDSPSAEQRDLKESEWTMDDGKKVKLVFGDYSKEMDTIAHHIEQAKKYAANDHEVQMMEEYSKSFRTGSLQAFKKSQMAWVQDKGPQVESDIGFIETYRDPHGIRGEWEGFVAMVNKERTRAFGKLVETAPQYIPLLPWDKSFEKDKFLSPDFTSLEVLTFAGSG
jgi:dipeptidyl-peptidase-3